MNQLKYYKKWYDWQSSPSAAKVWALLWPCLPKIIIDWFKTKSLKSNSKVLQKPGCQIFYMNWTSGSCDLCCQRTSFCSNVFRNNKLFSQTPMLFKHCIVHSRNPGNNWKWDTVKNVESCIIEWYVFIYSIQNLCIRVYVLHFQMRHYTFYGGIRYHCMTIVQAGSHSFTLVMQFYK